MQQRQRLRALDHFRSHDTCVLVASDVAARGLDIPEVSYVIHFGAPRTSDVYVHRSGRTARAGKRGISICMVGPGEVPQFRDLCNSMGKENMLKIHSFPTFGLKYVGGIIVLFAQFVLLQIGLFVKYRGQLV